MPNEMLTSKDLQRRYDDEAKRYDQKRYHTAKGKYYMDKEAQLLQRLCAGHHNICDIATGTGKNIAALAEQCTLIIGVDISLEMLRLAQIKCLEMDIDNFMFVQVDAENLPFKNKSFDLVLSTKFFHNIPMKTHRLYFLEMARVSRQTIILELKNMIAWFGLIRFISKLRRFFRGGGGRRYYPWEYKRITYPWKTRSINGFAAGLPFSDRIFRVFPGLIKALNHLMIYTPMKYIAPKLFYSIEINTKMNEK